MESQELIQEVSKKPRKKYKTKYNYDEIGLKYQTGQFTLGQLCKMYGIGKSTLSEYLSTHGYIKSEHSEQAISHLSRGFAELELLKNEKNSEQLIQETLRIVRERNPQFARTLQELSSRLLDKAFLMLEEATSPSELNQIGSVMQKVNDTLQVIPKAPLINLQNNIQNNTQTNIKNGGNGVSIERKEDFNININFVENKNKDKKEKIDIIDVESEN